jgi:hypothetical protein
LPCISGCVTDHDSRAKESNRQVLHIAIARLRSKLEFEKKLLVRKLTGVAPRAEFGEARIRLFCLTPQSRRVVSASPSEFCFRFGRREACCVVQPGFMVRPPEALSTDIPHVAAGSLQAAPAVVLRSRRTDRCRGITGDVTEEAVEAALGLRLCRKAVSLRVRAGGSQDAARVLGARLATTCS